MGTTSNQSYPYPSGSSAVDVPGDIQALAEAVDTDVAAIDANDWVTTARIDDGAVTDAKLAVPKVDQAVVGNLLTDNQASVETDASGFTSTNATLTRSTAQAVVGAGSLLATSTSASSAVVYVAANDSSQMANLQPVVAGLPYSWQVNVRAGTGTPELYFVQRYYNSGGTLISTTIPASATSSGSWQTVQWTAVAPANAAYQRLDIAFNGSWSIGDSVYLDALMFHQGAGGLFVLSGVPVPLNGIRTNPSNATQVQVWNPGNNTWITV